MTDTSWEGAFAMEDGLCDPDGLSRIELISLYINGYYALDADRKAKFEAAFAKRKLPLPRMPAVPAACRSSLPARRRGRRMDRGCFLSYVLLIYSGTAIFYSWIYLAERLLKMDFRENAKHKLIQSGYSPLLHHRRDTALSNRIQCSNESRRTLPPGLGQGIVVGRRQDA